MKTYKLNKEFIMSQGDIDTLKAMPDNLPDSKLTKKQIEAVHGIYYKYLGKVFVGWGTELYRLEKAEKWPSGPRVKDHEAKRMILSNLMDMNVRKGVMNPAQAAEYFLGVITCRDSCRILVEKAYRH